MPDTPFCAVANRAWFRPPCGRWPRPFDGRSALVPDGEKRNEAIRRKARDSADVAMQQRGRQRQWAFCGSASVASPKARSSNRRRKGTPARNPPLALVNGLGRQVHHLCLCRISSRGRGACEPPRRNTPTATVNGKPPRMIELHARRTANQPRHWMLPRIERKRRRHPTCRQPTLPVNPPVSFRRGTSQPSDVLSSVVGIGSPNSP
jgi:hypothetical protein